MALVKEPTTARVLLIDDQAANVLLLERVLARGGYTDVKSLQDSREVLAVFKTFSPDIVLLDLHMPHLDGQAVLLQLREIIPADSYLPILVLTADITDKAKQKALTNGAKDFLTKPFDPVEVLLRIQNLVETRFLHLQLMDNNQKLEAKVVERTRDVEEATYEIVHRLARAAEFRDDDTGQHTQRVGALAARLGAALGLSAEQVELLGRAAPLHDVGKIGISDLILLKPGKLTQEEFATMKTHVTVGENILAGSRYPLLQAANEIAGMHHERWDGSGYARGLSGADIPLFGRIVTVIDVFDALTHERPYKEAWPLDKALEEIRSQSGRMFDPEIVTAFLSMIGNGTSVEIL